MLSFILSPFSSFEQVDGMDALAVKQACKFAKEHALKNGPIVSTSSTFLLSFYFPCIGIFPFIMNVLCIRDAGHFFDNYYLLAILMFCQQYQV